MKKKAGGLIIAVPERLKKEFLTFLDIAQYSVPGNTLEERSLAKTERAVLRLIVKVLKQNGVRPIDGGW